MHCQVTALTHFVLHLALEAGIGYEDWRNVLTGLAPAGVFEYSGKLHDQSFEDC